MGVRGALGNLGRGIGSWASEIGDTADISAAGEAGCVDEVWMVMRSHMWPFAPSNGPMPVPLDQLSSDFWLYSNSLSSAIPTQFGLLEQMSYGFDLGSNSLSMAIPTQLGQRPLLLIS
mmetsp:Transcript_15740/g.32842  ORF Transcript_15740/g.32842 Transcript_15740/m.32842 type:complete len:118 (+) Transcript_15740:613-966(+)